MLDQISVVIITRDAAATFADTLKSTRGFGEVVVYDNGSNDATIEIAQAHENVSLHQGNFMGFGPTKNHAVSLAKNDWVLSLDADEAISSELRQFLERWVPESSHCVGLIRRDNYLMGKLVDKGGWGADWLVGHDCAGENPVADQAQRGSTPGTVPGENRQIFRNSSSNQ
jgi:glycosyltransferase involved in cell wall biosynthesis